MGHAARRCVTEKTWTLTFVDVVVNADADADARRCRGTLTLSWNADADARRCRGTLTSGEPLGSLSCGEPTNKNSRREFLVCVSRRCVSERVPWDSRGPKRLPHHQRSAAVPLSAAVRVFGWVIATACRVSDSDSRQRQRFASATAIRVSDSVSRQRQRFASAIAFRVSDKVSRQRFMFTFTSTTTYVEGYVHVLITPPFRLRAP
jgi:hypothetical protein